MRKRLRYDLLYLDNRSIKLDLKIMFMTIPLVLKGEGI
jgi:lipopolysaccharide/colanic/teichoic acid biosynthesis glycosyltransferase